MRQSVLIMTLAAAATAHGAQPPAATQPAPAAPAGPQIVLLDAGAAPGRRLRLTPKVGASHAVELTLHGETEHTLADGQQLTAEVTPPITYAIRTVVTGIDPGGDIAFDFECTGIAVLDDPGTPPQIVEAMRQGLQSLVGLRGTGVCSDRGDTRRTDLVLPPDLDPRLRPHAEGIRDLVSQVATPLPQEPVGVGGSWEARSQIDQNGIVINQTVTYTLTASAGDRIELNVELAHDAATQTVRAPGMPPGATGTLKAFNTKGAGRSVLNLDRILPLDSSLEITNTATMLFKLGDWEQEITQKTTTRTRIES